MIYLSKFIPHYCPSCGTPTILSVPNNPDVGRFKAFQTLSLVTCEVMIFQRAIQKDLFRAATASGGDLLGYCVEGGKESSIMGESIRRAYN